MQFLTKKYNRGNIVSSIIVLTLLVMFGACKTLKNTEAIDDANAYAIALQEQHQIQNSVVATSETKSVKANSPEEDSADDPAVWYNTSEPEKSLIFGSNKIFGIHSYDLTGKEIQFVQYAQINNIDIRQNLLWNGKNVDILAGSNRTEKTVDIFFIHPAGRIADKPDFQISLGDMNPYGFCLYKPSQHELYAFVNDKKGNIWQFSIQQDSNEGLKAQFSRKLKLSSQVEGMVADDVRQKLYVGEEMVGIYEFNAQPNSSSNGILLKNSTKSNPKIKYDIEGLALLPPHYLIASSQGNFSYAIFDVNKNEYITSFKITNGITDGVEETDGLEVYNGYLGSQYPKGIFVVQDGFNFDGAVKEIQNFKTVDLQTILKLVE